MNHHTTNNDCHIEQSTTPMLRGNISLSWLLTGKGASPSMAAHLQKIHPPRVNELIRGDGFDCVRTEFLGLTPPVCRSLGAGMAHHDISVGWVKPYFHHYYADLFKEILLRQPADVILPHSVQNDKRC